MPASLQSGRPRGRSWLRPPSRATEPRALIVRWQVDRDEAARDELLKRFLPLARKLARRYAGASEPFDDLFQVASVGLLKAMDRFDVDRGTAFSSFAVPTVVGELKRYFRDHGWSVRVPRGLQELAVKIESGLEELSTRSGRSPTVTELAQAMELSIEDVLDGLEAMGAHHSTSIDVPRTDGDDQDGTLADTLGVDDAGYELVDHLATIASVAHLLTAGERQVLTLRFFEDLTQSEIAREIGVSQMQVSRILRGALVRLRELTHDAA
jgi:RNA polymerase sigma-B factor